MNDLEQLVKRASEILGSEEKGQAFVDGFLKEAGGAETFGALVQKSFAGGMGGAAIGLVAGGVAAGIGALITQSQKAQLHVKFQTALNQVKASNRLVKAAPAARVDAYASTIFNFAPHVSADPNLLGSLLSNVIQGDSMDPLTLKMITELESRYIENSTFKLPGVKS